MFVFEQSQGDFLAWVSKVERQKAVPKAAQKEKTAMSGDYDIESTKRNYLQTRLWSVQSEKTDKLRQQFGLSDDPAPKTPAETVKRIQDGKFILDEGHKDRHGLRLFDILRWRDPEKKEDPEGYFKANEALQTVYTDTMDAIFILSPDEGLKALKDFEAWQYQS